MNKNRLFRIIKAGFCFSTFGIGALSIFLLIFPVIKIFGSDKNKSKLLRKTIHLSWKAFVSIMSSLELISVSIKNLEKLEKSTGQIIVANHPSLIDIVILISYIPNADCIVKSQLSKNFFMRGIVNSIYIINSANIGELLEACKKSLQAGNNLIIFPEGTRTVPDKKSKILRGAAQIAIYSQSNILPIKINCYPFALLKGQKWYQVANDKLNFDLEVKSLIAIDKYISKNCENPILARELTEKIKQNLDLN